MSGAQAPSASPPRTFVEDSAGREVRRPPNGDSRAYDDRAPERKREVRRPENDGFRGDGGVPRAESGNTSPRDDETRLPQLSPSSPPTPPSEDDTESPTEDIDNPNATERLSSPLRDLDNRITWRTIPERTRLEVRADFANPVVARQRPEINRGWKPVAEPESRVARR